MIRVTVWNEYRHEQQQDEVRAIYPSGLHGSIAEALREGVPADSMTVRTATLDEPEHGLPWEVLEATDVLFWWGHSAHDQVRDEIVERVVDRVLNGMGLVVLHSAHYSKVFKRLMGTSCSLKWREGDRERFWVVAPGHPIAEGLPEQWELAPEEMYGEHFDVPPPEELVFISWFAGGEVFRSGCCYTRGRGRIFYFQPGHETYPTYYHPTVRRVLINAARWVAPTVGPEPVRHHVQPLERPAT